MVEKRAVEVEFLAEVEGVPFVAVPVVAMVDLVRFVFGINGNYFSAGGIAFAGIKSAFVAKAEAAFLVAFKAEIAERVISFLINSFFGGGDFEGGLAEGAMGHVEFLGFSVDFASVADF